MIDMYVRELDGDGRAKTPVLLTSHRAGVLKELEFKVDTGADLTTVGKPYLLDDLGYSQEWLSDNLIEVSNSSISGTGGAAEKAYCIIIPTVIVFNRTLHNWPFYVRKDDGKDFPNLLGIDVLSHFNFTFNYSGGEFLFRAIKTPKIRKPMNENQSIDSMKSDGLLDIVSDLTEAEEVVLRFFKVSGGVINNKDGSYSACPDVEVTDAILSSLIEKGHIKQDGERYSLI